MDLSVIDWETKLFDMFQLTVLSIWCIIIMRLTLGQKETHKAVWIKGTITIVLITTATLSSAIGMIMLDSYLQNKIIDDTSIWNMMLSWVYVFYNTLYILAPTFLCYVAGRWIFHQKRSIKTFTAVLVGLIAIIIYEFVYRCMLLPFYQDDTESMTKIVPTKIISVLVLCICLLGIWFLYKTYLCHRMKTILNTPDGCMDHFVQVPVYSNVIFAALIGILQTFGISMAAYGWMDAMIYFMASCCLMLVYLMMYWSIFTGIGLSSQRIKNQAELNVATIIQTSVLPNVFPPFPNHDEFSIFASMTPAKEVGGDFYDFYLIDEHHLAVCVADVSGKGVPAALFMMTSRTLLKSLAMSGIPLEEVFTKANQALCENNEAEMFVTAWMGIIDLWNGKLKFVSAGHNPALLNHEHCFSYLDHHRYKRSLMLGARTNSKYQENELQLVQHDILFLYTDGVSEANNMNKELYGETRLLECLKTSVATNPQALIDDVNQHVQTFVNEAEPFDDITMLCLQIDRLPKVLQVQVNASQMGKVMEFVEESLVAYDCTLKIIHQALLSVDEIFSNIIKYSNAKTASMYCINQSNEIRIAFVDDGMKYNPLEAKAPDLNADLSQRTEGGLGIHVVKNVMDAMDYSYQAGYNILTIQKSKAVS